MQGPYESSEFCQYEILSFDMYCSFKEARSAKGYLNNVLVERNFLPVEKRSNTDPFLLL